MIPMKTESLQIPHDLTHRNPHLTGTKAESLFQFGDPKASPFVHTVLTGVEIALFSATALAVIYEVIVFNKNKLR